MFLLHNVCVGRTHQETTDPTDWLSPSWSHQSSPSCPSFSKVQPHSNISLLSFDSLLIVFLFSDMTFTHEGNKTFIDNMVNFEKMVSLFTSWGCELCVMMHFPSRKFDGIAEEVSSPFPISGLSLTRFGKCDTVEVSPSVSLQRCFQHVCALPYTHLYIRPLWSRLFIGTDPDICQPNKNQAEVRGYVRKLCVIDNQRALTQLSYRLEPRRTWAPDLPPPSPSLWR